MHDIILWAQKVNSYLSLECTHPNTQTHAHITHSWKTSGAIRAWQAVKGPAGSLRAPHILFPFSSSSRAFEQPVVSKPESGSASTSRLIVKKTGFLGVGPCQTISDYLFHEKCHPSWFIMHSITDTLSLPYLCRCTILGRDVVRRPACLSVTLQLSPNSLRLRVTVPSGFVYSLRLFPS